MEFFVLLSSIFCLYLIFKGVEYKELIKRLQKENDVLKKANRNLSMIVQEDQDE